MKRSPAQRRAALLACSLAVLTIGSSCFGQEEASPTAVLLSRARTLEQRGRLDLARQDWAQVLLFEPNEAQALAGLVRAERAEGHPTQAAQYLARLRAAHPQDPELLRLENVTKPAASSGDLAEADRLLRAGDARSAFPLYRRVYGVTPPVGTPALSYYQAEAATEEGRPQAIAGLRALADRYPADTRYSLALGRILLASPRTRAEGRTLLERYPGSPEAVAALKGGTAADAGTSSRQEAASARAPEPGSHAAKPSPATPLLGISVQHTTPGTAVADGQHPPATVHNAAMVPASPPRHTSYATQEQAGFAALNQHRLADAEQIFTDLLSKDPKNPRALAGLGYLHQCRGDLKAAVNDFEQAQESGDRSLALTRALVNAQFDLSLQQAASSRSRGELAEAESRYKDALHERPADPEAMEGLGAILLQEGRMDDAIPVYLRLTQVRPLSPSAWRGLVIAQASSGKASAALSTEARIPAEARSPLQTDASFLQAVTTARGSTPGASSPRDIPTPPPQQLARVEPPAVQPRETSPAPEATKPVEATPPSGPRLLPKRPVTAPPAGTSPSPGTTRPETPTAGAKKPTRTAGGKRSPAPSAPVAAPAPPAQPAPASLPSPAASTQEVLASERLSQADAAMLAGRSAEAVPLYREAIGHEPARPASWKGLVRALHGSGQDLEAARVLGQVPASAQAVLLRDATFQNMAGEVYVAAARPDEALHAFVRAQGIFATQHLAPPLELVLRVASLLAARHDDANLARQLAYLDTRKDLTDVQRRAVQMVWTGWAVRRARLLALAGEQQRAVTVLNATAVAFAGNAEVLPAVAEGYAGVGLPREAVALYKVRDLSAAPARELEAAIHAGTAAHDYRAAQSWARLGRERFPNDPAILTAAAELEQARGHESRAVDLSRQARTLSPAQDPGEVLTAELRESGAGYGWRAAPGGQLATLLGPAEATGLAGSGSSTTPYLPPVQPPASDSSASEVPVLAGLDEPAR